MLMGIVSASWLDHIAKDPLLRIFTMAEILHWMIMSSYIYIAIYILLISDVKFPMLATRLAIV